MCTARGNQKSDQLLVTLFLHPKQLYLDFFFKFDYPNKFKWGLRLFQKKNNLPFLNQFQTVAQEERGVKNLVEELGGKYLPFSIINLHRVEEIRLSTPSPAQREKIIAELGPNPTPEARYRAEYAHGVYHSYKPGIDDGLDRALGLSLGHASIIEIGGGPCTIAEKARKGLCLDLTPHPRLQDVGINFIQGDICSPKSVSDILSALDVEQDGTIVTVLSYCLDRVPDQVLALRHFAEIVRETNGIGLITVYLPARPVSPGIEGLNYAHGEWITRGHDPNEDYGIIVRSCQANGLRFTCGGLTSHFSTSLDSFEELGCWVMVFRPA